MRKIYDCDTYSYWCSENDYNAKDKIYGQFTADSTGYEIFTKNTPRPWLNYLCNDKIAAVVSNTGLGFYWYKTSLLRITKYEHEIDYQPRVFEDGRDVIIEDLKSGKTYNVFRDAENVKCVHRPGRSAITAEIDGLRVELLLFVPKDDPCECWIVNIKNSSQGNTESRKLKVSFQQTWSVARFGIHTAEEGIPYLSTPGKDQTVEIIDNAIVLHTVNDQLPVELWSCFTSPQCSEQDINNFTETRKDGRVFTFPGCILSTNIELGKGEEKQIHVVSGASEDESLFNDMLIRYADNKEFDKQFEAIVKMWESLIQYPSCELPDKSVERFLNIWLKNQIFTTFRYVRSGYIGYRDTIQDSWGYQLISPELARKQILKTLSHMKSDGSCPRNYSPFGINDTHDMRNCMDSATWIGMCICDYIKETGDKDILNEKIRYLDTEQTETVEQHIWKALDLLYSMRGMHGLCLIADGDWNDAIEGISKTGPAVSVWLTMATYHAQNLLGEVYKYIGDTDKETILRDRNKELYKAVNDYSWDGDWYIYAYSGSGNPIGSHKNNEGKIHLNSNTWAIFSGISDDERTEKINNAIKKHLDTFVGPALLAPPYVNDGDEVGRIASLEPGTFENGSVYQHAVCFKIFSDIKAGNYDEAYQTLMKLLPSNPENFDARRTSEPYCTGNYYCGPTHERAGQNFFTWFTGNPAWLLRACFDEILGVKADFDGIRIDPKIPKGWDEYSVKRIYRGTLYNIRFVRKDENSIFVDGEKIIGNLITKKSEKPDSQINVLVYFGA